MKLYTIVIKGIIGIDVLFEDIAAELAIARKYDGVKIYIDSLGGYVDEGKMIYEAIERYKSDRKIVITENSGNVCSAAVAIFLTADKGNRFFNPAKGDFLIHNPYAEFQTGDAEEFRRKADELQKIEDEMAALYAAKTGANIEDIKDLMKVNEFLKPETIEKLGFATIIKTEELKAVAYFKNNNKMENVEKKLNLIEQILAKMSKRVIKALVLQDNQGNELDFGEEITDPSQIQVGVTATVGGQPANGKYVMADGTTYVFENGKLVEIIPAESSTIEELKKEIEQLKAENEELKNKIERSEKEVAKEVKELTKQLAEIKALYKSYKPQQQTPSKPSDNDGIRTVKFF